MAAKLRHFIESQQLDRSRLESLFRTADKFGPNSRSDVLKGKILATLFYEQSTRTRLSFESAALRMGASVISTSNAKEFSSAAKGESLEDSVRIVAGYSDAIVLRHFEEGAAQRAAAVSRVPIINAGDGPGQHPTQALLDAYTIHKELGQLDTLRIAFVGDLKFGRTVRSLCYLLAKFNNIDVTFVSPENLRMRKDIKEHLKHNGVTLREEASLKSVLPEVDIIYVTRLQKERMSKKDYNKARGKYVINQDNLKLVREDARIMHPLPHVEDIALPISIEQNDRRVAYFRQAENGLYVRMALLTHMLK
jgi:aspartate carbamoyltransferase catalytic subunit